MKRLLILLLFPIFVGAQTTITIGTDTLETFFGPIYIASATSTAKYSWNMCIYEQTEMATAGGYASAITSAAWFKTDSGAYADPDGVFEIYIKHTTQSSFAVPANFNNEVVGATLVFNTSTYRLPTATGWLNFNFLNPFYWNGLDNIMILTRWVRIGNATAGVHWQASPKTPPRLSYSSSTTTTMGTLQTNANRPNVRLGLTAQAPEDAGVTSIDSIRGRCAGNVDVYATIQNFGSNVLTSATIQWKINDTLQTPFNFTGSLASGATTQVLLGSVSYSTGLSHSFDAWTESPNALSDTNNLNDTIITTDIFPGLSGMYTIGTGVADFSSFSQAAASLETNGVCGPVEFVIDSGTYNEQVNIHSIPNASLINTVLFRSALNDSTSVTLNWPSSASADTNYTLRLIGTRFVTFQSIHFSRTGTAIYSTAVEMTNGSSDITFNRNLFSGPNSMTTANTTGTQSGIFSPGTEVWNNLFITNNHFIDNSNGVWVNGTSVDFTDSLIVTGNIFETFYVGVFILYQNAPVINDNIFTRNDSLSTVAYFAISLRYGEGPFRILNNKVTAYKGTYGFRLRAVVDSLPDRALMANNFIQVGPTGTGRGIAIEENSGGIDIYHNSVNYTGANATTGRALFIDGANTFGMQMLNNIFCNIGGGYTSYVSANATPGISVSDNNCLYTTGTALAYYNSAQATLTALQLASGKEGNTVNGNPQFISFNDLHTTATILSDAGSGTAGITNDIDGDLRILASPDIGADEFLATHVNTISTSNFEVFPNPASNYIIVRSNNSLEKIKVLINDMAGRVIYSDEIFSNQRIDITDFSKGVYVLELRSESGIEKKVIVLK